MICPQDVSLDLLWQRRRDEEYKYGDDKNSFEITKYFVKSIHNITTLTNISLLFRDRETNQKLIEYCCNRNRLLLKHPEHKKFILKISEKLGAYPPQKTEQKSPLSLRELSLRALAENNITIALPPDEELTDDILEYIQNTNEIYMSLAKPLGIDSYQVGIERENPALDELLIDLNKYVQEIETSDREFITSAKYSFLSLFTSFNAKKSLAATKQLIEVIK